MTSFCTNLTHNTSQNQRGLLLVFYCFFLLVFFSSFSCLLLVFFSSSSRLLVIPTPFVQAVQQKLNPKWLWIGHLLYSIIFIACKISKTGSGHFNLDEDINFILFISVIASRQAALWEGVDLSPKVWRQRPLQLTRATEFNYNNLSEQHL